MTTIASLTTQECITHRLCANALCVGQSNYLMEFICNAIYMPLNDLVAMAKDVKVVTEIMYLFI
jgi:hypothetical protein